MPPKYVYFFGNGASPLVGEGLGEGEFRVKL